MTLCATLRTLRFTLSASARGSREWPTQFPDGGFQREVARIVEINFRVRIISNERFGACGQEERIVLTSDSEQRRPLRAEIFLEPGIECDVAGVIQEEVKLDLVIAGPGQQCGVELVRFGRYQRLVLHAVKILRLGRFGRKKFAQRAAIFCRRLPARRELAAGAACNCVATGSRSLLTRLANGRRMRPSKVGVNRKT